MKLKIKSICYIIFILIIIFISGFEVGILSKPIIQTTIYLNNGNYTLDIGNNLFEVLNKTSFSNTTTETKSIYGNTTIRTINMRE